MTRPVNVAILGATGSIGQQTLDVIDRNPARLRLFGLTEGRRSTKRSAEYLIQGQAGEPDFDARVEAMVTDPRCDLVVVAIPGARALAPTLAALTAGKEVALATKEVLVMAGALVMRAAGERGIRPVDSEHSAIWQCLWGERRESIRRLILTASGGPFWAHPDLDLDQVTVEQALNHPRWSMGPKVTVDSATLMNKGLEVIEAHHLFGVTLDQIAVFIHPQSVVHSLVEFVDGSLKGQLGHPDMRLPIAVALGYPDRLADAVPPTALEELGGLEFHALDEGRFDVLHAMSPSSYIIGALATGFASHRALVMSRVSLNFYQHGARLLGTVERLLHRRLDLAIANAEAILGELGAEGIPASRLRLIRNGIDSAAFTASLIDRGQARALSSSRSAPAQSSGR